MFSIDNLLGIQYNVYEIYNLYIIVGGFNMTTQLMVRIDQKIKDRMEKLARLEGMTTSQMVRELIEEHLRERDIGAYIDDLWDRIGAQLKSKGVKQTDIDRAIKASRTQKA
jgi:predicted DNA-binding protein